VLFAEKLQEAIYLNGALLKNSLQIPANSTLMDTFSANLDLGNSVKRHLLQQDQLIDAARTATARHWNATPANWHPPRAVGRGIRTPGLARAKNGGAPRHLSTHIEGWPYRFPAAVKICPPSH
jgi:hypothetical protein